MAFNIDQFRSELAGDGARPNLFQVSLVFPGYVGGAGAARKSTFMCKTAQLPGSTVGVVEVPYFGRMVKVAGNRVFAEWTVTVINDEDFVIRNAMERWHRGINDNVLNVRNGAAATSLVGYGVDASVVQYSKVGNAIKGYTFVGMFPSDITPIDLDWGANDTIEEYSVTFAYQYWTTDDQGSGGGVLGAIGGAIGAAVGGALGG